MNDNEAIIDTTDTTESPAPEKKEMTGKRNQKDPASMCNGLYRPGPGTVTGQIWDVCDNMSRDKGAPISSGEVRRAVGDTFNAATLATQYNQWRVYNGLAGTVIVDPERPARPSDEAKAAAKAAKKQEAAAAAEAKAAAKAEAKAEALKEKEHVKLMKEAAKAEAQALKVQRAAEKAQAAVAKAGEITQPQAPEEQEPLPA